jgi:hypothetical protein
LYTCSVSNILTQIQGQMLIKLDIIIELTFACIGDKGEIKGKSILESIMGL